MAALPPPSPISYRDFVVHTPATEVHEPPSAIGQLEEAIEKGLSSRVQELLETEVDLNVNSHLLQKASNAGDILSFYFLLEYGVKPGSDFTGTPLHKGLASIYNEAYHSFSERRCAVFNFLNQFKAEKHPGLRGDYEAHQQLLKEMGKLSSRLMSTRESSVEELDSRVPSSSRALF